MGTFEVPDGLSTGTVFRHLDEARYAGLMGRFCNGGGDVENNRSGRLVRGFPLATARRGNIMDCSKKGLIKIHNKSREQKATSELSRPSRRSAPSAWRRTGGWLLPVLAAAIIFAPPFAPTVEAQTTLVSNVAQTRSGSLGLDTHEGAQAFTTGDNSAGYTVTSVGLDLSSGADHTINFTVGIWTNSNSNLPGSSLVTLTQPASLTLGVNEFTTSGIELAANTTYWVVVDSSGGGSVQWEGTASDSEDSTASGWSIADESYDRPYDGGTWGSYTDPFKFRVNGTAIGSITNSAPVFTEGTSTTRSVAENTASGQNIGAPVTATDADTSDTLTYTLGGTDAADFGIVNNVQRPAPDQRRAQLRDESQLCDDGFGLRRQRRRGQHRRDHQRHECGRAQQRAGLHRGNQHDAQRRRGEHGIGR